MRLLTSLVSLLGFAALSSVHACGYGKGKYTKTYFDHISVMFTIDEFFFSIATEYDYWYGNATAAQQGDEQTCVTKFIEMCTDYQKGSLTIHSTYDINNNWYFLYAFYPIYFGLQYEVTAYVDIVTTYIEECGYDTFQYIGPPDTAPTPPPGTNASQLEISETFFTFVGYKGYSVQSELWKTLGSCWTGYDAAAAGAATCYSTNEQCIQTGPVYAQYPDQTGIADWEPDLDWDNVDDWSCSVEQYYSVLGYIFSTEEIRTSFAISFYNYYYSCGGEANAVDMLVWNKVVKDSCLVASGTVTITSTSGQCTGTEMVAPCVEMIYELIDQKNIQVMYFLTYYMYEILGISPQPSNMTFSGNVAQYSYMFLQISTSAGFVTWSEYTAFYAEWTTFCAGQTTLTWIEVEIYITRFFNLCCQYTTPTTTSTTTTSTTTTTTAPTTELPTTELPTTEFTSELPTTEFTSELPTTEFPTTEFTSELPTTEFTSELPSTFGTSEAPCVIVTPEDECKYILAYFRFVGFLYVNEGWRTSLNTKCLDHKNRNPNASSKDKAKHFAKATHECAHDLSYCGSHEHESSHECVPQGSPAPPPSVTPPPKSGEQPPMGEDSWEYFIDFSINIFLVGDFELLTECACTMQKYMDTFITPATFSSSAASGEEPTVSPGCDEIKSPTGIFIFFEIIAVECGFSESFWWTEWILKFEAIYLTLDFDCGCWESFEWTWSITWIELIVEFLEAMSCGCSPTEPPPPEIPEANWDIFRFFAFFCSDSEYTIKFEAFMTWYFDQCGYTEFEVLTVTQTYECISLFIEYMVICVEYPTTPAKPPPVKNPSLKITYDTFMYTCMYYVSYSGESMFVDLFAEKYDKCKDLCPGGSHESSHEDEASTIDFGMDMCKFTIKYMAVCQGVWNSGSEWTSYWTQWEYGWTVVEGVSVQYQWQQASQMCDNAIRTICDWTGPWATTIANTGTPTSPTTTAPTTTSA